MIEIGFQALSYQIIKQAIDDYKMLIDKGISKDLEHGAGVYSIIEIEEFFKSNWCNNLLNTIGADINGKQLLSNIKEILIRIEVVK